MKQAARKAILALAVYFGVGLVIGVALLLTGRGESDYHWSFALIASMLWWPLFLFGTIFHLLTRR